MFASLYTIPLSKSNCAYGGFRLQLVCLTVFIDVLEKHSTKTCQNWWYSLICIRAKFKSEGAKNDRV